MRLLLFLSLWATPQIYASCSGVPGCDPCRDSVVVPSKEETACHWRGECTAILNHCGDWMAVNKSVAEKMKAREEPERQRMKREAKSVKPSVVCLAAADGKRCQVVQP